MGSGTPLSEANQYLFFDNVHPTAAAHHLTADFAYAALAASPVTASLAMPAGGFAGSGLLTI